MQHAFVRLAVAIHVWLYRLTGGRLGGRMRGAPVLLLKTKGRKSGKTRTIPLLYLKKADDYYIVASYAGAPKDPVWYRNLVADEQPEIVVGNNEMPVTATTLEEDQKAGVWPDLVALYSDYATYQQRTDRKIPVVKLSPA